MKEPELYYAQWLDSNATSGWTELKDFNEPCATIKTIGWLIFESDESITIAGSIAIPEENIPAQANCFVTIPRVALKQFYKIQIHAIK